MIVDFVGQEHPPAQGDFRIVSLVPSLTETLFEMGLENHLVGRTSFCVHPRDRVKPIQSVGGTKAVNMRTLQGLAPTHVLVNVDENPKELAEEITGLGVSVIATHPVEPFDNITLFRLLGDLFGAQQAAARLSAAFQSALTQVRLAAEATPERRVLYLIWKDPWMTVSEDTYIAKMLQLINWRAVGGDKGMRYPVVTLEGSTLSAVDEILLSSEPFAFDENHRKALENDFAQHSVKISLIDGEMTSWYGSRAIRGLDYLRKLIQ